MKLIKILISILSLTLIMSSCSLNTSEEKSYQEERMKVNVSANKIRINDEKTTKNPALSPQANVSIFHSLINDIKNNSLILLDHKTDSVIKRIKLKKNCYIKNTYTYRNGYVALMIYSNKPIEVSNSNGIIVNEYPDKINKCVLRIYDSLLNFKREIEFKVDNPKQIIFNSYTTISDDGNKIAWAFMQKILVFNLSSKKLDEIFDDTNTIYFSEIGFSKDSTKMVFSGSSLRAGVEDCLFGYFDLRERKLFLHNQKEFNVNRIFVSSEIAYFCDDIDARTQKSSGKVILLDLKKDKSFILKVDGTESTMVRISNDGNYLFAIKKMSEVHYRIRQYDIKSNKIVSQKEMIPKNGESEAIDFVYSGDSSKYYLILTDEHGKFSYHSYSFGGI